MLYFIHHFIQPCKLLENVYYVYYSHCILASRCSVVWTNKPYKHATTSVDSTSTVIQDSRYSAYRQGFGFGTILHFLRFLMTDKRSYMGWVLICYGFVHLFSMLTAAPSQHHTLWHLNSEISNSKWSFRTHCWSANMLKKYHHINRLVNDSKKKLHNSHLHTLITFTAAWVIVGPTQKNQDKMGPTQLLLPGIDTTSIPLDCTRQM